MRAFFVGVVAAAATLVVVASNPAPAQACGGFFCSNLPIDQSAERIIFAQHEGQVQSWVQIVFNGSAEDFAWVVPVAAVPEVDVADSTLFTDLDQMTAPVIIPPSCAFQVAFDADGSSPSAGGNEGGTRSDDGVIIFDESDVGPYHTVTVGSESASLLIEWLNENGYIITPAMYPMVEEYVNDDMLFLAMKLQVGQGVDALQPIVMTYEADNPVVPIRLTAVAADPNMGILIWFLGDARAASANYQNLTIDDSRIRFDSSVRSNYRTVVTEQVDEVGGQAFVTEYAGLTETLFAFSEPGQELLDRYTWLTRLYTTMSPEEMSLDPIFTFNPSLPEVSNVIDLSTRDDLCEDPSNSPCDFNYCGPGSTCYVVNGAAACECGADSVARGVPDPVTGAGITCVPEGRDLLEDVTDNPCASRTCGEFGECVNVNGNATCSCDPGFVASATVSGGVGCLDLTLGSVGPREVDIRPGGGSPAGSEAGCSTTGSQSPWTGLLLMTCLGALVLSTRRWGRRA